MTRTFDPAPVHPTSPSRVQLSRAKGWRMPENTVKVDRTTRWGNPWVPGFPGSCWLIPHIATIELPMDLTAAGAVDRFRRWLRAEFKDGQSHPIYGRVAAPKEPADLARWLEPLRGKNLACWCKIGVPCHADVLLQLANEARPAPADGNSLGLSKDRNPRP